ncbi:MAG: ISAzo13-like element transposase-related protein, partial [Isosphaeraceae bacterium]
TTTSTGLIVKAALDTNHYDIEIKVSDEELAGLRLQRHEFHGDWNYTISPRAKKL